MKRLRIPRTFRRRVARTSAKIRRGSLARAAGAATWIAAAVKAMDSARLLRELLDANARTAHTLAERLDPTEFTARDRDRLLSHVVESLRRLLNAEQVNARAGAAAS